MDAVKKQIPFALAVRTSGKLRGPTIGPKDEYADFVQIALPQNTKVGSVFKFDITQRNAETGALVGSLWRLPLS